MNLINKLKKQNYLNRNFILAFVIVFLFFSSMTLVFAQDNGDTASGGTFVGNNSQFSKLKNPIKSSTIQEFVRNILEGVLKVGIPLVALAIIYSGFLFVTALGNPGKIEEAKKTLTNTIIGAALLLGAWGLSELIVETVKKL